MTKIVDIRALQGAKRSGVEVYIEGFLDDLISKNVSEPIVFFANAKGNIVLPDFIDKYKKMENVFYVKTSISNKLLNLSCSIFRWPKLDKLHGLWFILSKLPVPYEFWVLDPRPAPVSTNIQKYLIVHDIAYIRHPEFFSRRALLWFKLIRLLVEMKESTVIFAVSRFTKMELISTYPDIANKIHIKNPHLVLHNIKHDFSVQELESIRTKYNLFDCKFLFSISTLEPRKNINKMIDMFLAGSFPEYTHLVIAGVSNSKIFSSVNYKKNSNIIFTGFVPENDKWALYKLASGFICLSCYEGFGIPILEAMQFKLPLILSNIPPFREIVGKTRVKWIT